MHSDRDLHRYETLLGTAELVVRCHSVAELFSTLTERLRQAVAADAVSFSLYDPTKNVMRLHLCESTSAAMATLEVPVDESPAGWAWQNQQSLLVPDVSSASVFLPVMSQLRQGGLLSYGWWPMTTAQGRLGALGLGSIRRHAYSEQDQRLLARVAELVAMAVENALTREALTRERERLQNLLDVNQALLANHNLRKLLPAISSLIRRLIPFDYASVALYNQDAHTLSFYPLDSPWPQNGACNGAQVQVADTPAGLALMEREIKIFSHEDLVGIHSALVDPSMEGIQSLCCIPLATRGSEMGTLSLASKDVNTFQLADAGTLRQVACQVAVALDNTRAYCEIADLTGRLASERIHSQAEIRNDLDFEDIVGESEPLHRVLARAKTVAPSDSTVLILGDTGVGKELIARAIHRISSRRDRVLVKLNCAAIPTGLLESELFGHEKGAFTGAVSQKIGRLELADEGTLFLDEVGDIPLELQPKLLRVLQDHEFERLGGTRTIRVNIRLIAATNRDLAELVANREFRNDLYYRLHVFPISLPSLAERRGDIPLLARHFVQKFARRMNKRIETIPGAAMNALVNWSLPGNVRELENFIERSVILSDGPALNVPLADLGGHSGKGFEDGTLEALERQYIVRVLRETGGVISGPQGAASRLGMKRTTLQSRILRMGISRQEYE